MKPSSSWIPRAGHFALALLMALALAGSGCSSAEKRAQKKAEKEAKKAAAEERKADQDALPDMSGDVAFQSFLGRLRTAVDRRDHQMLASMMTPNFGYRWDNAPAGETPFHYWDQRNLWGELADVLGQQFTSDRGYMVAPPAFVADTSYSGYRAGIAMVNGTWKFAYFVGGMDIIP